MDFANINSNKIYVVKTVLCAAQKTTNLSRVPMQAPNTEQIKMSF